MSSRRKQLERLHTLQNLVTPPRQAVDAPAILMLHDNDVTTWTYGELSDYVERLAQGLVAAGVQPGEHIGILAGNRPEWIIACFAILRAGAVVMPLDSQITLDHLRHTLNDSMAQLVFTTTNYVNRLQQTAADQPLRTILFDVAPTDERSWRALLSTQTAQLPTMTPEDPAALFYTSGTTGVPKGVPLSHANLAFQIYGIDQSGLLRPDDRVILPLPMYHVYPFSTGLLIPFGLGLSLVLPEGLTGPQIVRAMRAGKPTVMIGVPRLYRALYTAIEAQFASRGKAASFYFNRTLALSRSLRERFNLHMGKTLLAPVHSRFGKQFRLITSGGSALDPELAYKLDALGWEVAIGYGLTETSPLLTINIPGEERRRLASAGQAMPGIELKIAPLDPDVETNGSTDTPRPEGSSAEGEVLARGIGVFAGYRNLPTNTSQAFTDDGWFRTGDLGYFDSDQFLYLSGRASTLIVTEGGKNIQPEPVEEIYQEHRFIEEIGILQHDNQLVALIVPNMEAVNNWRNGDVERAMHEALGDQTQKLPTHQRVTDFATLPDELPKTNLGKIRRHKIKELYAQAKRGELQESAVATGPLPLEDMTESDRELLDHTATRLVWKWLAERYPDQRLTPDTSPQLDLGIDSLSWLNLSLEISERTGVELSEEAIARVNTVRDLLREVRQQTDTDGLSTAPAQMSQETVLSQPETILTAEQLSWLEPQGKGLETLGVPIYVMVQRLLQARVSLTVSGIENLPANSNFVLTPNHTSYIDAPVVSAAIGYTRMRQTYWAGSTDVMFVNPIARLVSRLAQVVPVAGTGPGTGRSSLAFAAAILERGYNLVWFPEGHLSPDGKLLPFRQGLGLVLAHTGTPVIPVSITNAYRALPAGQAIPDQHPVSVTFGKPYKPSELEAQGQGATPAERIMNALHDRMLELRGEAPVNVA